MQLKTPTPELEAYKRGYEQGRFDAEMDLLSKPTEEIPGFEGTLQALGKI